MPTLKPHSIKLTTPSAVAWLRSVRKGSRVACCVQYIICVLYYMDIDVRHIHIDMYYTYVNISMCICILD